MEIELEFIVVKKFNNTGEGTEESFEKMVQTELETIEGKLGYDYRVIYVRNIPQKGD